MLKGTPARRASVTVASCWVSATRSCLPLIQAQHMGPCVFMNKKLEDVRAASLLGAWDGCDLRMNHSSIGEGGFLAAACEK